MIGRLNHVAIAVPDLAAATAQYKDTLGAEVSAPLPQPEHGVTVVFVILPNTKIELLEPLGEGSPIASFLQRNPAGGIHHICYEVDGHPGGARPAEGRRRARAGRRRAQDRRARQARAVSASQGFQRRAGRTRAGVRRHELSFAIAIYLIIWWTVLFAVLPIGVRTQGEDGVVVPGTPESAPTAPRLLRVVVLTTVISALVFAALWALVSYGVVDLDALLGRSALRPETKRARPCALL